MSCSAGLAWCWLLLLAAPSPAWAQNNYAKQGDEYPAVGSLLGDQVYPDVKVKTSGGFLTWQDNYTDGEGLGISAVRLDSSFSPTLSSFRVNEQGAFDQERPRVALLNDGGAVFVWQGGQPSSQRIYARFLSSSNIWMTGDILVNTFTNSFQRTPVVTVLANGTVVVAWSSYGQAGTNSLQDVFAQRFSATGQKLGGEFRVNQFTVYNQRTPAVAALNDGRFVVAWVSEQQRFQESVDIYARVYGVDGNPAVAEFVVNTSSNLCGYPSLAADVSGGFLVAWSERNLAIRSNGWDVVARPYWFAETGGLVRMVNTHTYGDQIAPQVSANGSDFLTIWTSFGQDGSREGVYGRFLRGDGSLAGSEFKVNTTTASQQMHPTVASDSSGRFLAVWTSFVGGPGSFDLSSQRYASTSQPLNPPDPPFVHVLSSNTLSVTWPELAGFSVGSYEIYADGAVTPTATVTSNSWRMTGLPAASTHYFRLAFVLTDGRHSPLSTATTNTTFGALTYGGVPYEWMSYYFGGDVFNWPSPFTDSDGDGVNNRTEFLAGTDPTDPTSVLRQRLRQTIPGLFLEWNTQVGMLYQVWQATASEGPWAKLGGSRFAAGAVDSAYVGGGDARFYRVERLR